MPRIVFLFSVCTLAFLLIFQSAVVAEEFAGKPVHDKDCLKCHGVEMYSRDPLFVKSYRQLDAQVNACAKRNNIQWTEDQTEDIIDYLCDAFYGFE